MKTLYALGLLALLPTSIQPLAAQGNEPVGTAAAVPFLSAKELAAVIKQAQSMEKVANQASPAPVLLKHGPFRALLEYRVGPADGFGVHEHDSQLFVVIDGSGTMGLGGRLVNPTRKGTNLFAATAEGLEQRKIAKGDMFLVPEYTVHGVTQVDGQLVLMSMQVPLPTPTGAPPAP